MSSGPNWLGWNLGPVLMACLVLVALLMFLDSGGNEQEPPPWAEPGATEGTVVGRGTSRGTIIGRGASEAADAGRGAGGGDVSQSEPAACGTGDTGLEDATAPADDASLAGAVRIGGGGQIDPSDAAPNSIECARLDDLDLSDAMAVAADGDGGVWLLVPGPGDGGPPRRLGFGDSRVLRAQDGQVDLIRDADGPGWLAAGPDGDVTVAVRGDSALSVLGSDPAQDRVIDLRSGDLAGAVFALGVTGDGTVLAARRRVIAAFAPDGGPGDDVPIDGTDGQVASLVVLPDDRVAFVTTQGSGPGESPLHVVAGDEVRTIGTGPRDRNRQIRAIAPAPDGRLLAIASGPEAPQIMMVDLETGETEIVADLEGVMPHPDGPGGVAGALWPVSAAVDGDDLVFLADGHLWRLADAIE